MPTGKNSKTVSVTLPLQVIDNAMKLKECGHYGKGQGEILKQLIFLALRDDDVQRQIEKVDRKEKA